MRLIFEIYYYYIRGLMRSLVVAKTLQKAKIQETA